MKHEKLLCSALCLSLSFSLFACSKASTGETSFIIERRETEDARESEPDSSITTENTTSEETVETTPETTVKEIIVRDAYYEEVYNEYLQDYLEVHIPEIIIGDLDMKDLNSEIYAKLEHVSRSKVTYEYYIGKGFLSLNISVEPFHDESPADSFYVYNISTETGNVLSRDEMIALCNIDEDAMDSAVEDDIQDIWERLMLGDYMLDEALSEDTIKRAYPYYDESGNLNYYLGVGIPAGSGYMEYESDV
jgi:hypothetical protein